MSTSLVDPAEPLRNVHDLSEFTSGEPELDLWLRKRATRNETDGASRTYVVCYAGTDRVAGYYCLATGAVQRESAPGKVRRNMPDPIPVIVLGRLAADESMQSRGLGRGLLRDAILRTCQVAEQAGVRALLVHALSEEAATFYERAGFRRSPITPDTLMLRLAEVSRPSNDT